MTVARGIPIVARIGQAAARYAQPLSQALWDIAQLRGGGLLSRVAGVWGWIALPVPVASGGTGAATAGAAATALGLGTASNVQHASVGAGVAPSFLLHASGSPGGGLPVAKVKNATAYADARGIGVELADNPSATGDYFVYFEDAGGLRGSISGDGGTGIDVNLTSDMAEKQSVRRAEIGDARAIIRAVQEADWEPLVADHPKSRRGRGYIAQELHAVYPDAVRPGHDVGRDVPVLDEQGLAVLDEQGRPVTRREVLHVPWQIAPMRLIPVITRALREQDAEIEALKARIAALEAR